MVNEIRTAIKFSFLYGIINTPFFLLIIGVFGMLVYFKGVLILQNAVYLIGFYLISIPLTMFALYLLGKLLIKKRKWLYHYEPGFIEKGFGMLNNVKR